MKLYIQSTDTLITDENQRYVHPVTNEVYGKSDYYDLNKRQEMGAIPVTETFAEHDAGDILSGYNIVVSADGKSAELIHQYVAKPAAPVLSAAEIKQRELNRTDAQLIMSSARAIEDILVENIANGKYVSQKLKDIIAERVELRKQ
jgi:hypothetical protein